MISDNKKGGINPPHQTSYLLNKTHPITQAHIVQAIILRKKRSTTPDTQDYYALNIIT